MSACQHRSRPIMPRMCKTCPFREGSKLAHLKADIAESAKTSGRLCHSTHKRSAVYDDNPPIKTPHICRGARDQQLRMCYEQGLISAPTDEAWQETCDMLGIIRDRVPDKDEWEEED